jgi:hypothetical protein
MTQLECLCDHGMSNVASPSPHVFHLVSDAQAEEAFPEGLSHDTLLLQTPEMWVCSECGNLAISLAGSPVVRWFVPHGPVDTLAWLRGGKAEPF